MNVKKVLLEELSKIKEQDVGILLSGGNGSASVLFTLMELEKNIHAYTFHVEGYESTDLKKSRNLCEKYNIKFTPIPLPLDINIVKKDCDYLIRDVGCRLKTDIECCFAYKYVLPYVEENVLTSGLGDDNYFGLSKKAQMHYKNNIESMNEYRNLSHSKYENQIKYFRKMANNYNIELINPYQSMKMCEIFHNKTFDELNKPKKKQWILNTFPEEFKNIKFYHANFQKGDSKISEIFTQLVESEWNKKKYKSVVGIYNSIFRGEI